MQLRLELPDVCLDVNVVRRPRKSIGIRIDGGRVEIVAPPRVALSALQTLLDSKRDWVARHWRRQQAQQATRSVWPDAVWLQGRALPLLRAAAPSSRAACDGHALHVGGDEAVCRAQVAAFLRREAQRVFPGRLARLATMAVRPPQQLALSSARTRWGSCSAAGVVRLNWRLIQAPESVLDYVIAHELAHLRHMNHSAQFWAETARLYPDWQTARHWLQGQGDSLFAFG